MKSNPSIPIHTATTSRAEYPEGGHFAALEVPGLVVGDLREFFVTAG
ncbi:hypothetical protein [Myceligenerans xiligouense]|nr:hypothetical protein [Myceligenerans xiligouense]